MDKHTFVVDLQPPDVDSTEFVPAAAIATGVRRFISSGGTITRPAPPIDDLDDDADADPMMKIHMSMTMMPMTKMPLTKMPMTITIALS